MRRPSLPRALRWLTLRLALATVALLVLSRWFQLRWQLDAERHVTIALGTFDFTAYPGAEMEGPLREPSFVVFSNPPGTDTKMGWWFHSTWRSNFEYVSIPLWCFALAATMAAAACWWVPMRTAVRRRRSACLHCGYPRRGLAPDAPCPECGRVPAA